MSSWLAVKILHLLGVLSVIAGLAGIAARAAAGAGEYRGGGRRLLTILHGLGLLLVLFTGIWMLVQWVTQVEGGRHGWLAGKLVIWLLFGAAAMLPVRRPGSALPLLVLVPVIGAIGAYLAILKPF
jgi:hypothetical protein